MLISLLWVPILLKKIFSGNNLSSGTRYYSHFFKEHFLHLISQETFPPKLSSAERRSEQRKRCMFLCCWTWHPSLVEASGMAGISQGAAAQEEGCCDFMALPEVLSKHFTELPPVPSPKSKDKNQAALHAHTATTCKNTPPCRNRIHKRVASKDLPQPLAPGRERWEASEQEEEESEKHRNTQSRGWSCCLKITSQLHWVHASLAGSLPSQEQWVRFPPQTSFPLSPHLFKAQTYLQFQTTSFHVPRIRHQKASTLCCTRKIWM